MPIKSKKQFSRLKNNTLRLLARRPYSIFEINRYLQRKYSPSEITHQIIQDLLELDLLDDSKFSAWWIEQRSILKPSGPRKLTAELRQKGVSSEIIQATLLDCDFLSLCQQAANSRSHFDQTQLKNFLVRRGFIYQTINQTLTHG